MTEMSSEEAERLAHAAILAQLAEGVIVTDPPELTTPLAPTPTPNCANALQIVQRSVGMGPLATDCKMPSRMSS